MSRSFLITGKYILLLCLFAACQKSPEADIISVLRANDQIETEPATLVPMVRTINPAVGGYYVGLPSLYNQTTKRYPFILFLAGGGQAGNGALDLPLLLNDGIVQLLDEKIFPPNFNVNGANYSFIIMTPQFLRTPTSTELLSVVDYAKKNYRIDTTRFYLSGLSYGGILSSEIAAIEPSKYAALVTMAGSLSDSALSSKCSRIAASNLPVWALHNLGDPVIPSSTSKNFVNTIQTFHPPITPRLTLFDGTVHDCWTKSINPSYRENGMNIYEFMLQYHR